MILFFFNKQIDTGMNPKTRRYGGIKRFGRLQFFSSICGIIIVYIEIKKIYFYLQLKCALIHLQTDFSEPCKEHAKWNTPENVDRPLVRN